MDGGQTAPGDRLRRLEVVTDAGLAQRDVDELLDELVELLTRQIPKQNLPRFEIEDGRLKVNPLGDWTKQDLETYFAEHHLPRHPLEAQGYLSVGCQPCTSIVAPGEDPRAGRWRGWDKTECGIHRPGV